VVAKFSNISSCGINFYIKEKVQIIIMKIERYYKKYSSNIEKTKSKEKEMIALMLS